MSTPGAPRPAEVVGRARRIADEVLFPAATAIDLAPVVPSAVLDEVAAAGLYGLYGPVDAGGLAADAVTGARVTEALGGGSLTTAFVWIQHHSALRAARDARPAIRDRWLEPLCRGSMRAGVATAALRRPGPPVLTARQVEGGWLIDGTYPWITGWDRIGVVYAGARVGDDVLWALVDAAAGATVEVRPVHLAAVASSSTVAVRFDGHPVPDGRVVGIEPFTEWQQRDRARQAGNGYLSVGVAARCATLLGSDGLSGLVDDVRRRLDTATGPELVQARSDASLLAVRAATTLVAAGGGRSIELGQPAQRLAREAMFLLVFGQTADIRAAQRGALLPDG